MEVKAIFEYKVYSDALSVCYIRLLECVTELIAH